MGSGAYDLTGIIGPSSAVVRGDELWFYYTGIKYRGARHRPEYPHGFDLYQGAICLAVLRRDGFISLDADEEAGTVLTKPFSLLGQQLFVNVDAPQGELRTEVLDMLGRPWKNHCDDSHAGQTCIRSLSTRGNTQTDHVIDWRA